MLSIYFISLGVIILFFIISFFYTQLLYAKNKFLFLYLFSLIILSITWLIAITEDKIAAINFGAIFLYYTSLLHVIKAKYTRLNNYLIRKKYLRDEFINKDFTYIHWNSLIPTNDIWWDKKLAGKPSWLDYILTYLLLILPILLTIPLTHLLYSGK